ncbi:hypothetical protein [Metabacillus sp. RGM 3146]|uniref:hypothetical protein n=1 Tax=Metabacillus sp. RGM 3146 TaxID=3401092 RepID=UPI003B9CDD13
MKKLLSQLFFFSIMVILASGCTNNQNEYQDNLSKGLNKIKAGDYKAATVYLNNAKKLNNTAEKPKSLLQQVTQLQIANISLEADKFTDAQKQVSALKQGIQKKNSEPAIIVKINNLSKQLESKVLEIDRLEKMLTTAKELEKNAKYKEALSILSDIEKSNSTSKQSEQIKSTGNDLRKEVQNKKELAEIQMKLKILEEKNRTLEGKSKKQAAQKKVAEKAEDFIIEYSFDENGNMYTDYPNGITLTLTVGQKIYLKRTNKDDFERLLASGDILEWKNGSTLVAIHKGAGTIDILPHDDWDKAYTYNVVVK